MSPFIMIAIVLAMGLLAFFSLIFSKPPSTGQAAPAEEKGAVPSKKQIKKQQERKPSKKKTYDVPSANLTSADMSIREGKVDDMRLLTTDNAGKRKNKNKHQEEEDTGPAVPTNRAIRKMAQQGWSTKVPKPKTELTEAEKAEKAEQKRIEEEAEKKRNAPRVPKEKKPEAEGEPEKKNVEKSMEEIAKILQETKAKKQKIVPKSSGGTVRNRGAMPAADAPSKTWDASQGVPTDEYDMIDDLPASANELRDASKFPNLGSPES